MEEETQEWTDITLTEKFMTLELMPESKHSDSFLKKETEKPVFLKKLSPLVVSVGGSAVFSIRTSGFPEPVVQWLHNGQKIGGSMTFTFRQDADEFSLVIGSVKRELAGEYSCTIRNPLGQSTCTSFLHVSEPEAEGTAFTPPGKSPKFTKAIKFLQRLQGDDATFSYSVTGEPRPDIQWFRDSLDIQLKDFCVIVNRPDGSGFLNIQGVKQEHSGLYTCKAYNQYGEALCSAELLVSRREESILSEKSPVTGPRSKQEGNKQIIYTLSGEQPEGVSSEDLQVLPDLHISSAHLHQAQLTCQTAIVESYEVHERVGPLAPPHPALVAPVQQNHMTSIMSTVQESPKTSEQHLQCILSPTLLKAHQVETIETLNTVSANAQANLTGPEQSQSLTEPRLPISCHQVETVISIQAQTVSVAPRPEKESSFRVKEGQKPLHLAQLTDHLLSTVEYCESLPAEEPAVQSISQQEKNEPLVAGVIQSRLAFSKEQVIRELQPRLVQENINPHRDFVCQSAATVDEKYLLRGEQTSQVPALDPTVSRQPQREILNLQVIADQEVLLAEARFSKKPVSVLQAGTRRSPTLLHSATCEYLHSNVCEATSQLPATTDYACVYSKEEPAQTSFLQSVHSPTVLPKEGVLPAFVPKQQMAAFKQNKVRKNVATTEERQPINPDHHKPLDVSVVEAKCLASIEPTALNLLSVSCKNILLPKETPFISEVKQQRALIQKQEYCNTMHAVDISETHTLEESHAQSLKSVASFSPEIKTEPKVPKNIVFIEDTAVSSERCTVLQDSQHDFAVHIQEGQSVCQSVSLDERRVILGEKSDDIQTWDRFTPSVVSQPREPLFAHESLETQTLPKELYFVIQAPKEWSAKIGPQLRTVLQSAVSTNQEVLLADVLGRLEDAKVHEAKIVREPKQTTYTYIVDVPGAAMEIALSFEGNYPQTADLRSELQVALQDMLACDQHSLLMEKLGDLPTDSSQRALPCLEPINEVASPVVDILTVMESLAGLPPSPLYHTATVESEPSAAFLNMTIQGQVDVGESEQVSSKSNATANDGGSVERRDVKKEFLVDDLVTSKSSESLLDFPFLTDSLQDFNVKKSEKINRSATLGNTSRVDWFLNGQLVESGSEFKCMGDRVNYTLVIDQVMEKHQGEFVCQAQNEAGKTAPSSQLSLVSKGLMVFFCHHHLTSPDLCGWTSKHQSEPKLLLCLTSQRTHPNFFSPSLYSIVTSPLIPLRNIFKPLTICPPDRSPVFFACFSILSSYPFTSHFLHSLTLCASTPPL